MPNVAIVGKDVRVSNMFTKRGWKLTVQAADAHLIQFLGGDDVDPGYYGEGRHATTRSDPKRDAFESSVYYFYKDKIPMAGICRGGQFLNVMNGGTLWQHVNKHMTDHTAMFDGVEVEVSSDHHQMIRPTSQAKILGTANRSTFRETAETKNEEENFIDIESVAYPNVLCFQPHPEYFATNHPCQDLYFDLLEQYLGVK